MKLTTILRLTSGPQTRLRCSRRARLARLRSRIAPRASRPALLTAAFVSLLGPALPAIAQQVIDGRPATAFVVSLTEVSSECRATVRP